MLRHFPELLIEELLEEQFHACRKHLVNRSADILMKSMLTLRRGVERLAANQPVSSSTALPTAVLATKMVKDFSTTVAVQKSKSSVQALPLGKTKEIVAPWQRRGRVPPTAPPPGTFIKVNISLVKVELYQAASFHLRERLEALGRTLQIVAIWSSQGLFPTHSHLNVIAAKYQDQSGVKAEGTEAAHVGQMITVGGYELNSYADDPLESMSVLALHTHTHEVPREVNEIDSWLERNLLKKVYQEVGNRYILAFSGGLDLQKLESSLVADYVAFAKAARLLIEGKAAELVGKVETCRDAKRREKLEKKTLILQAYWDAFDPLKLPDAISRSAIQMNYSIFGPK